MFAAFNAVVSHYELVQTVPRAFYELGLIVVIALAFVPTTIPAIHDVREADRSRTGGKVVRRGRLVRQIVPILEHGLERAITLAESMDSRGFARLGSDRARARRGMARAGIVALLRRGVRRARGEGAADRRRARGDRRRGARAAASSSPPAATGRIRYRPRRMTPSDWCCCAAVLLTPVLLGVLVVAGEDSTFVWTPSPRALAAGRRARRARVPAARSRPLVRAPQRVPVGVPELSVA